MLSRGIIAILLTAVLFGGFTVLTGQGQDTVLIFSKVGTVFSQGDSGLMTAETQGKPERELSVLFIGNSYTLFNEMPQKLVEVARSDPGNTVRLHVQMFAKGGVTLDDLWNTGEARQLLRQRKWDYVILQDNSLWVLAANFIEDTTRSVTNWAADVRAVNARPLLMMTWVRQPGSHWYTDPKYSYFTKNPDYFLDNLQTQTYRLGKALDIPVIPVGVYWSFALQGHPELNLYESDGTHPAPAGSYLNALLFYRFFTGRPPGAAAYRPYAVTEEQAAIIRKIASYGGK